MTPRFVFWQCTMCDDDLKKNDCFGGGKYCAYETVNSKQKGQEIIKEDLR